MIKLRRCQFRETRTTDLYLAWSAVLSAVDLTNDEYRKTECGASARVTTSDGTTYLVKETAREVNELVEAERKRYADQGVKT